MNEAETRAELIDPVLAQAGWGVCSNCFNICNCGFNQAAF